jgi:predicted nucleic acid-binding protein
LKYLLDASALLPLVTRRGRQLIVEASHEHLVTTDLAVYEACDSLWKLSKLKFISIKDAIDAATTLKDLTIRSIIKSMSFTELDFHSMFRIAHEEGLTFYDASYIVTAEVAEAILVTEDEKLQKTAGKFVKTISYADLEGRLSQS